MLGVAFLAAACFAARMAPKWSGTRKLRASAPTRMTMRGGAWRACARDLGRLATTGRENQVQRIHPGFQVRCGVGSLHLRQNWLLFLSYCSVNCLCSFYACACSCAQQERKRTTFTVPAIKTLAVPIFVAARVLRYTRFGRIN